MITNPLEPALAFSRRAVCEHCARPVRACLCAYVTPIVPKAEVLILQHPMETRHPKGSARLLHLSLKDSVLVIGESFDPQRLHHWLHGSPACSSFPQAEPKAACRPILLYPSSETLPPASVLVNEEAGAEKVRLVILDGTWRKSLKMLHLNPPLQTLPRLGLRNLPASRYAIRHARHPEHLSTLEAACHALAMLERDDMKYQPLLDAFDRFVMMQKQWFKL